MTPQLLTEKKFNILIGGQLGSEGKGAVANYIGVHNKVHIAVSNAGANSGHTFYRDGDKLVTKYLPISGLLNDRATIYLCAGAIIDPDLLLKELKQFSVSEDRVVIHPRAAIIAKQHREAEQHGQMKKIASTRTGNGAALVDKIKRTATLAQDEIRLRAMVGELNLHQLMDDGCTVFMEVPQGFELGLNTGLAYPYCTSREITVSSAMADAGVHPSYLGATIMVVRTYPIRVGNISELGVDVGYSGPFNEDSSETTWEEMGVDPELTTVTNRVRRVATFSLDGYKRAIDKLRPDYVFLTFANYLNPIEYVKLLEVLPEVTHISYGKEYEDVIERI